MKVEKTFEEKFREVVNFIKVNEVKDLPDLLIRFQDTFRAWDEDEVYSRIALEKLAPETKTNNYKKHLKSYAHDWMSEEDFTNFRNSLLIQFGGNRKSVHDFLSSKWKKTWEKWPKVRFPIKEEYRNQLKERPTPFNVNSFKKEVKHLKERILYSGMDYFTIRNALDEGVSIEILKCLFSNSKDVIRDLSLLQKYKKSPNQTIETFLRKSPCINDALRITSILKDEPRFKEAHLELLTKRWKYSDFDEAALKGSFSTIDLKFPVSKYFPFFSFHKAKKVVQEARVKSQRDYQEFQKKDPRLPFRPSHTYASEWIDWYEFLGKKRGERVRAERISFAEAKRIVQEAKIKSQRDYQEFQKKDPRLPANLIRCYASEWISWYDFLGKEAPAEKASFDEAKKIVQEAKVKSQRDYQEFQKKDPRLPSAPYEYYTGEWVDWYEFLGTKRGKK